MNKRTLLKYGLVLLIVVVGVFLDQWTKQIAEDRLATQRPGHFSHNIVLEVPEAFEGQPLHAYLAEEFERNTPEEISYISRGVTDDAGIMVFPDQKLEAGQALEVRHREVVVVPDYWDFQYTRNRGAAFSFLADSDSPFRTPFFVIVSLIAVFIIGWILREVALSQQALIWGLSFVASGALGNLIDRVRLGYVVDFVVWKVTDAYRWPTFNVADALICVGVGLMVVEMIRDGIRVHRMGPEPAELPEPAVEPAVETDRS